MAPGTSAWRGAWMKHRTRGAGTRSEHSRTLRRFSVLISGVTQAGVNTGVRIGPRDTRESCALETPPELSPQRLVGDQGGRNWQIESKLRFMKKELFR